MHKSSTPTPVAAAVQVRSHCLASVTLTGPWNIQIHYIRNSHRIKKVSLLSSRECEKYICVSCGFRLLKGGSFDNNLSLIVPEPTHILMLLHMSHTLVGFHGYACVYFTLMKVPHIGKPKIIYFPFYFLLLPIVCLSLLIRLSSVLPFRLTHPYRHNYLLRK